MIGNLGMRERIIFHIWATLRVPQHDGLWGWKAAGAKAHQGLTLLHQQFSSRNCYSAGCVNRPSDKSSGRRWSSNASTLYTVVAHGAIRNRMIEALPDLLLSLNMPSDDHMDLSLKESSTDTTCDVSDNPMCSNALKKQALEPTFQLPASSPPSASVTGALPWLQCANTFCLWFAAWGLVNSFGQWLLSTMNTL